MADPTSAVNLGSRPYSLDDGIHEAIIKNSEALVLNAFVAIDPATGYMEFADDVAGLIPCGILESPSDGNVDHLTGNASYKAIARGKIVVQWPVTGAASVADVGKQVYATDGQTLTLTAPTTACIPVGKVVDWVSSTTCKVRLYSFTEASDISDSMAVPQTKVMSFGTWLSNALQSTSATTLFVMPAATRAYRIVSLHAQCVGFDNAAIAGSQAINIDIDGTNTTGGVLTLAYTNCDTYADVGVAINATAITAANSVAVGSVVTLEMAGSGTGFTADAVAAFLIYAVIQELP